MTEAEIEASARAIAAEKRKLPPDHPTIDKVWSSYIGQAKAAVAAADRLRAEHWMAVGKHWEGKPLPAFTSPKSKPPLQGSHIYPNSEVSFGWRIPCSPAGRGK